MTRHGLILALGWLAATTTSMAPAEAVRLADGTVSFVEQPTIVDVSTTQSTARAWAATYYFSLALPQGATEPLQRVQIDQNQRFDLVEYRLRETKAFVGTRSRRGDPLVISDQVFDPKTGRLTVVFDPPIPPGTVFTIALRPVQNPTDGVYLFGVTAFPAGEQVDAHFMGFGRLHFYSDWL